MLRGGHFILFVTPKGCEVEEHIATNLELNTQMLSTSKMKNTFGALTQRKTLRHTFWDL